MIPICLSRSYRIVADAAAFLIGFGFLIGLLGGVALLFVGRF